MGRGGAFALGLFVGGVLGAGAVRWALGSRAAWERGDEPSPHAAEAPTDGDRQTRRALEGLAERLESVARDLEVAALRVPVPAVAEGSRSGTATSAESGEELRILRELQGSVRSLLELRSDPRAGLQRLREERPTADWSELDLLLSLHERNVEQARKRVQLLSEFEVLRRYGSPDLIFANERGEHWVYGRGYVPERDAYQLQLVFRFQTGLVRAFHVERL
jgi:hypothetical protein